jgi:hypothetical protein
MIKLRFGEAIIQSCDVMLKDVIESKRVDRLIQMRAENVIPHHPTPYQVPPPLILMLDCPSTDSVAILLAPFAR